MFALSTSRTIHGSAAEIALLCAWLWLGMPGDASAAVFDTINRIKSSGQLHVAMHDPDSTSRAQDVQLLRGLSDSLGAQLTLHRYTGYDALFQALSRGEVDLIGEPLATSRTLPANLEYSLPVRHNDLWLVSNAFHYRSASQSLGVQYQSDSWHQALRFRSQSPELELQVLPAHLSRAEILGQVASGRLESSLAYAHEISVLDLGTAGLRPQRLLRDQLAMSWVFRGEDRVLRSRVNDYVREYGLTRDLIFANPSDSGANPLYQRVFKAFVEHGSFSPYDHLVRRYAGYYDFDWRLILAVIFQESRFDPQAISRSGARGLMQVQDVASRQVGISDLHDPRSGIHAGVKYLDWVRNQFEPELDVRDRTWFSLASYNGGIRHVREARQHAEQMGLDPRHWFGQVEIAFNHMAQTENDPSGRYATLDEAQVIDYVRRIRASFENYVRLTELPAVVSTKTASAIPLNDRRHAHTTGSTNRDQTTSRATLRQ